MSKQKNNQIDSLLDSINAKVEGRTELMQMPTEALESTTPKIKFSISIKLALLISFLIIIIMSSVTFITVNDQRIKTREEMIEKGTIISSQLARSVIETMTDPNFYQYEMSDDFEVQTRDELVANISQNFRDSADRKKSVVYIKLYDKKRDLAINEGDYRSKIKKVPFYNIELKRNSAILAQSKIVGKEEITLKNIIEQKIRDILKIEDNIYDISFPVAPLNATRSLGEVHVGISQVKSNEIIVNMVLLNLKLALVIISVGFIMALLTALIFTRPIAKIKDAMVKISEGDLNQYVKNNNKDEIGILTWNFNFMTAELRDKETMRDRFGKAVSEEIVEVMMSGDLALGGEDKKVTMLFSDIRSFTKLSSSLNPAQVLEMLNEYFTIMERIVKRNLGIIDKYVGDEIMAIYGAIDTNQDDPLNACRTAVEMIMELHKLNQKREAEGKIPIRIGIGINSGIVTAGMLGSRDRMNYTVIGDTVNMASRLCDAGGSHGFTPIVIAEDTYQQVKDFVKVRAGHKIAVKGKDKPIPIYELLGILDRSTSNKFNIQKSHKDLYIAMEKSITNPDREYQRITVIKELDMSVRLFNSTELIKINYLSDVSFGGMKFFVERKIPLDEDIDVRVNLDHYTIRLIANVKRCIPSEDNLFEIGVAFVTISAKNLAKLIELIQENIKSAV